MTCRKGLGGHRRSAITMLWLACFLDVLHRETQHESCCVSRLRRKGQPASQPPSCMIWIEMMRRKTQHGFFFELHMKDKAAKLLATPPPPPLCEGEEEPSMNQEHIVNHHHHHHQPVNWLCWLLALGRVCLLQEQPSNNKNKQASKVSYSYNYNCLLLLQA
jgi:hypothetical protein